MNEHDVVFFHNHNIFVIDNNTERSDTRSDVSDEDTLYDALEPTEDDIFSEDHPWDTRVKSYRLRPELWNFTKQELAFFMSV
jgi:hypothetical protein